jgi:hypothetical protein
MAKESDVVSRRNFLRSLCAVGTTRVSVLAQVTGGQPSAERASQTEIEDWMTKALQQAQQPQDNVKGMLQVSRFAEPMYYLLTPISWNANTEQENYPTVTAPRGFVSDLASIPRKFWSLLPPDGEYAYAAIIHDYLYWTQTGTRQIADKVLKLCMEDFHVSAGDIDAIYLAVRGFGGIAWNENAELKRSGQRRILTRFPTDPTTRWSDWQKDPANFS